ncbi:TetR/AcrR family transcriptional regulator [Bradyrhizobium sp. LTSP885]|uniref:TetR/AcrR family transcriptional regulator n=1 Tax=Bradyrhizobium sp. LTSP885 TaxID=1619232 RepID=UPI0009E5AD1E|nr:TetR/AcrR family transcriptional regulator [Bradyrhizobium sp. LTSP885]
MSIVSPARPKVSAPQPGRAGRPRDPAMQRQILEAAKALVGESGCAALTIEGVAAKAGVSKQSVYRRWSSRGDLLVDLYLGSVAEEPEGWHGLGFKAAFTDYVQWSVRRLFDPKRATILRGLAMEAQADPAIRQVLMARIVEPRLARGRELLRRAANAGDIRKELDIETALDFVFGSVWFGLLITGSPINRRWQDRVLREFFILAAPVAATGVRRS